jgi:hypothetical protein
MSKVGGKGPMGRMGPKGPDKAESRPIKLKPSGWLVLRFLTAAAAHGGVAGIGVAGGDMRSGQTQSKLWWRIGRVYYKINLLFAMC